MKLLDDDNKRLWILSSLAGAAILVFGIALFRPPRPPAPSLPTHPKLTLGLGAATGASADPLFREDAEAHDPTPLFLPTRWNGSEVSLPPREQGGAFENFAPRLAFSTTQLALDLPQAVGVPARPADALEANPPGQQFVGVGRSDRTPPVLTPRSAYVEVVDVGTGRRVLAQALADLPTARADSPPQGGDWEFMAAVDAAGLVGTLVPTVRSGTAADGFFVTYLVENLRVGDRLPPGFYRISVGP